MQQEWYSFREEYLAVAPKASFKQLSRAWHIHKAREEHPLSLNDLPAEVLEQIANYNVRGNTAKLQRLSKFSSTASARRLAELCVAPESPKILMKTLKKIQPDVSAILVPYTAASSYVGIYGDVAIGALGTIVGISQARDGWTITKPTNIPYTKSGEWTYELGQDPNTIIDPSTQKELLGILRPSCVSVYPNFADGIVKKSVIDIAAEYYLKPFINTPEDAEKLLTGKIRVHLYRAQPKDTIYTMNMLRASQQDYMSLLLFLSWLVRKSLFHEMQVLPATVTPLREDPSKQNDQQYLRQVYDDITSGIEASLSRIREVYLELFPV